MEVVAREPTRAGRTLNTHDLLFDALLIAM